MANVKVFSLVYDHSPKAKPSVVPAPKLFTSREDAYRELFKYVKPRMLPDTYLMCEFGKHLNEILGQENIEDSDDSSLSNRVKSLLETECKLISSPVRDIEYHVFIRVLCEWFFTHESENDPEMNAAFDISEHSLSLNNLVTD